MTDYLIYQGRIYISEAATKKAPPTKISTPLPSSWTKPANTSQLANVVNKSAASSNLPSNATPASKTPSNPSSQSPTSAGFSLNALSAAVNNVSSMAQVLQSPSSVYTDNKDKLKLVGSQMSKMDLWNPILEYFGKYFVDTKSTNVLDELKSRQFTILDMIEKLGIKISNDYRETKGKYISDTYRTKDDTQFRKVINIFKHYFYFVALYNMQFLEYINSSVKSGEIFTKEFADKLSTLYDPPRLQYIENGYVNPKSKSEFNNKVLANGDWDRELDDKTEAISSGFSKNEKWDFNRLAQLYVLGLKVDGVKNDKGQEIFINVGDGPERKKDITEINETIAEIIFYIVDSLHKLGPNLIRSTMKNVSKETVSLDLAKKEIQKKLEKINEPYQTQEDLAKMSSNFRGTNKTDRDNESVLRATQIQKEQKTLKNKIKNKLLGKNK